MVNGMYDTIISNYSLYDMNDESGDLKYQRM